MTANAAHEARLQHAVMAFIGSGVFFMLLPGTFLGVWNLISITNRRALESLSPAWIQAHGHAQIFGWIGTFVLGIGFYSLSKMRGLAPVPMTRVWLSYGLWISGVALRWGANVTEWRWRIALPVSAALELAGFLLFFATVSHHKSSEGTAPHPKETWMLLVMASTFGFFVTLCLNAAAVIATAVHDTGPAISHVLDQRLLAFPTWAFLVPAVWGFNARWLPVFLGLRPPGGRRLLFALACAWSGAVVSLTGHPLPSACILMLAAIAGAWGMGIFAPALHPPKTVGIHPSFPFFVKTAYVWLLLAGILTIWAAAADRSGGIWGASRHALTVGFLAAMVFAIGQRILPAFCGARVLFSKRLMFASLALLNIGCALRVGAEIPAYEGFSALAWRILPVSAVTELAAVTLFAANLLVTFLRPPAHLAQSRIAGSPEKLRVLAH